MECGECGSSNMRGVKWDETGLLYSCADCGALVKDETEVCKGLGYKFALSRMVNSFEEVDE